MSSVQLRVAPQARSAFIRVPAVPDPRRRAATDIRGPPFGPGATPIRACGYMPLGYVSGGSPMSCSGTWRGESAVASSMWRKAS